MARNTQVAADHNAPPVTQILAKFVATHPSKGWNDAVDLEAHRTFTNWLGCAVGAAGHEAADAALAMSTLVARPSTLACGAGCSIATAASAASAASCPAAPTAQPSQLVKVRCASWSTASLQPLEGWVATNFANICVTGGALWSAVTWVLRAMKISFRVRCCGLWQVRSSARFPT